jgi:hypothetical protein
VCTCTCARAVLSGMCGVASNGTGRCTKLPSHSTVPGGRTQQLCRQTHMQGLSGCLPPTISISCGVQWPPGAGHKAWRQHSSRSWCGRSLTCCARPRMLGHMRTRLPHTSHSPSLHALPCCIKFSTTPPHAPGNSGSNHSRKATFGCFSGGSEATRACVDARRRRRPSTAAAACACRPSASPTTSASASTSCEA